MLLALLLQFVHFDVVLGQNRATTLIVLLVSELLDLRLCFFGVKKFAFHDTLFAIQLHFDYHLLVIVLSVAVLEVHHIVFLYLMFSCAV